MRCKKAQRWISPYLDGEISERRLQLLEAHFMQCDRCSAELGHARRVWEMMGEPLSVKPRLETIWSAIHLEIESARQPFNFENWKFRRLVTGVGIAVGIFAGFIAGTMLSMEIVNSAQSTDEAVLMDLGLVSEAFGIEGLNVLETELNTASGNVSQ